MGTKAAIYLRLSKEDSISDESNSIANQRRILYQFAQKQGITIAGEFIDDGISGTKWKRAGLQELLSAAEDGWINTILVKDLSRLSRDYIRTGELLERWFPMHGIRLISVSDQIDTAKTTTDIFSPLRAVIDDWYARDISRKVRTSIHARQSEHICTAARLPYGYRKNGENIVIEEDAASTVRHIFHLWISGKSCCAIAKELTDTGIPAPAQKNGTWNDNTVRTILRNPVYIGQLHLHTTERFSYKCEKKQILPESEHIILDVPPIISSKEYQAAQATIIHRKHIRSTRHWMSGCLFCEFCGKIMILQREGNRFRAICSNRKQGGICRNPSVRTDIIVRQMMDALQAYGICSDENLLQRLLKTATIGTQDIKMMLRFRQPTADELAMLQRIRQAHPAGGFEHFKEANPSENCINNRNMGKINK